MNNLEKYWLVKSARSISREQLREIVAEIAEAKNMYMPRRGRPVAAEPLHIKYGPKVHFGRGRYGTHVAREGADGTEHLYKDRVFIGDARGGYGRKLYPEELEMVQDLIKTKSDTLYRYTTDGKGVFRAGKEQMPEELIEEILEAKKWLANPGASHEGSTSYFTPEGAKKYEETLMPLHKKYLKNIVKEEILRTKLGDAIYKDEHQVLFGDKS